MSSVAHVTLSGRGRTGLACSSSSGDLPQPVLLRAINQVRHLGLADLS